MQGATIAKEVMTVILRLALMTLGCMNSGSDGIENLGYLIGELILIENAELGHELVFTADNSCIVYRKMHVNNLLLEHHLKTTENSKIIGKEYEATIKLGLEI